MLIPFPFTNLKGTKRRPAVILYKGESDVIVSFITSKIVRGNTQDLLVQPDVANGLKKPSLIKTHKIATLETELIIGKIGAINKDQIHELNLKLKRILGL
ncbi:type II toxin-antitoxin system PemK/MazF family toxin [Gillisia limnaea]